MKSMYSYEKKEILLLVSRIERLLGKKDAQLRRILNESTCLNKKLNQILEYMFDLYLFDSINAKLIRELLIEELKKINETNLNTKIKIHDETIYQSIMKLQGYLVCFPHEMSPNNTLDIRYEFYLHKILNKIYQVKKLHGSYYLPIRDHLVYKYVKHYFDKDVNLDELTQHKIIKNIVSILHGKTNPTVGLFGLGKRTAEIAKLRLEILHICMSMNEEMKELKNINAVRTLRHF